MLSRTVTISALLTFASALSVSQDCTRALTSVATNPDSSACLTPSPLIPLFLGSSNTSIVEPVNNWLTSLCAAGPCSNATLASIVNTVTAGCTAELSGLGFTSSSKDAVTTAVQQFYPTVRRVACLKDRDDSNNICVTQTLRNIQTATGTPLSIDNIVALVGKGIDENTIPKNVTCTNCIKGAYNIVNQDAPGLIEPKELQEQCGSSFTDGNTPSSIFQSASQDSGNSAAAKNSGSLPFPAPLEAVTALLAMSSGMFAFLA